MNSKKLFLFIALFFTFLFSMSILVAQQPLKPHTFYGKLYLSDGNPAPPSLTLVAKINDVEYGRTTTSNGRYDFLVVTDPENKNEGETIYFYVEGILADPTDDFKNGGFTEWDLTLTASLPVPVTPTPTVTDGGGDGGGGGGGGRRVTTTTVPSSECGDDTCGEGEDCSSCPSDCGECPSVRMDIIDMEIPENITEDTPFEIFVTVKNVGDEKGSDEITLALPKDWKSDTWRKSVTLDVDQSMTLKFTITPGENSGEIAVGSSVDLEKSGEITPKILLKRTEPLLITGIMALIGSVDWMVVVVVLVIGLIIFFIVVREFKEEKFKKFKYKFKSKKR